MKLKRFVLFVLVICNVIFLTACASKAYNCYSATTYDIYGSPMNQKLDASKIKLEVKGNPGKSGTKVVMHYYGNVIDGQVYGDSIIWEKPIRQWLFTEASADSRTTIDIYGSEITLSTACGLSSDNSGLVFMTVKMNFR